MGRYMNVFGRRDKNAICIANAHAHKQQQKMKNEEARLMWSESISRPIPGSERSSQVKTAKKIHAAHRQKKELDGLYDLLAPGRTVGKVGPTKSIIKEPNRPEARVRNSHLTKFGTRQEWDTELGQYIDTRSKKVQEKTKRPLE